MASTITKEGREWVSEKMVDVVSTKAYIISIGTGTTSPSENDTSLENEVYRANDDDSNCTVRATTNTGEIEGKITVSGGTEVPGGTDISEFGLFVSDGSTIIYRETRTAVTINDGDRKTFEFNISVDY